ncbi:MAG: anti-sigma factor family protein [Phycisphaerae bacterium]
MSCGKIADVHRYHDGELSPAGREAFEAHLRGCHECGDVLADLRRLSVMIAGSDLAPLPADLLSRVQELPRRTGERAILRIAGWLTAAAAAVLIGALLGRPADGTEANVRPAVWQTLAVMSPAEVQPGAGSDPVLVAQWMADELSVSEKR